MAMNIKRFALEGVVPTGRGEFAPPLTSGNATPSLERDVIKASVLMEAGSSEPFSVIYKYILNDESN